MWRPSMPSRATPSRWTTRSASTASGSCSSNPSTPTPRSTPTWYGPTALCRSTRSSGASSTTCWRGDEGRRRSRRRRQDDPRGRHRPETETALPRRPKGRTHQRTAPHRARPDLRQEHPQTQPDGQLTLGPQAHQQEGEARHEHASGRCGREPCCGRSLSSTCHTHFPAPYERTTDGGFMTHDDKGHLEVEDRGAVLIVRVDGGPHSLSSWGEPREV